jgi:hypothetical protein
VAEGGLMFNWLSKQSKFPELELKLTLEYAADLEEILDEETQDISEPVKSLAASLLKLEDWKVVEGPRYSGTEVRVYYHRTHTSLMLRSLLKDKNDFTINDTWMTPSERSFISSTLAKREDLAIALKTEELARKHADIRQQFMVLVDVPLAT